MPPFGTHLTLMMGPTIALPAPEPVMEALDRVEVTHQDQGRSGFQLTFQAGRPGPADVLDYSLLRNPLFRPFTRVVLMVTIGAVPQVLMDGVVTHQQTSPSSQPGASTVTLTGEDVSVMMDLKQKQQPWPAMPEPAVVAAIVAQYAQYGLVPLPVPPPSLDLPLPIERTPMQVHTDLGYLQEMAGRYGYVFYVDPGPAPMSSLAYWGPPPRVGLPQRALSVNVGPESNVDQIGFSYNALAPNTVAFRIQDRQTQSQFGMETFASTRPPLAMEPALIVNQPNVRRVHMGTVSVSRRNEEEQQASGLAIAQAIARAQGMTDSSTDNVVTASGTLDASRYGGLLKPRGLVALRGAGFTNDGLYYVKSVSHSISRGEYKQRFTLTREGTGSLVPAVLP
jgi:hypothetical protein